MKHSIFFTVDASILCLFLFVGCILMVIIGKWARDKFLRPDEQESKGGVNALLGALFGLWGFILAFTFGNVSARFENVRATMVDEANLIRTVILRAETLPDSLRGVFQDDLQKYLQTRIDYYEYAEDLEKFAQTKQDAAEIGKRLWTQTVTASAVPGFTLSANNMLAALAAMYDVGARRDATLMSAIPTPISVMLFFIALVISFVGGFTSPVLKMKEWVVIVGFILLACLIIYVTLDMARPMRGFIRPDVGQEKIQQLKELF
jgi:ABC-type multidrug transport system fused ATPase/permease subunit